ncbi:MAG: ABC transporter permease, partial [Aquabacterium sp.]
MSERSFTLPAPLRRALPWLVPAALMLLWEASSRFGWLSTRVLPEPWSVIQAFWRLAVSGELWQHLGVSAARALIG